VGPRRQIVPFGVVQQKILVAFDLPARERLEILAFLEGVIPFDDPGETLIELESRVPVESCSRLGRIKAKQLRFGGMRRPIARP
jgi:hypothetical protein